MGGADQPVGSRGRTQDFDPAYNKRVGHRDNIRIIGRRENAHPDHRIG